MKRYLFFAIMLCSTLHLTAQGFAWGVKGGLSAGFQKWENFQRQPLYGYHGILFMESLSGDVGQFSLFGQMGYHTRGSAIRNQGSFQTVTGSIFRFDAQKFIFNNVSLAIGAKRRYGGDGGAQPYYMVGARGEYTVSTNLKEYAIFNQYFPGSFPLEGFVNKINYGLIAGGGIEIPFTELIGCLIEFTINPDFSFQYRQPAIPNVRAPWNNTPITIPERKITNTSLELTIGFRFLNKIEYEE